MVTEVISFWLFNIFSQFEHPYSLIVQWAETLQLYSDLQKYQYYKNVP